MSKATNLLLLPEVFKETVEADKEIVRKSGQLISYKNGEEIVKEGTIPDHLVMVQSGYAAIQTMGRILEIIGPGGVLGPTLLSDTPMFSSLTAIGNTNIMVMNLADLKKVFLRNPQTLLRVMDITMQRAYKYQALLHRIGAPAIEIRYASVLWNISIPQPDGSRQIPSAITQNHVASLLRTTREEISRKRKILIATKYLYQKEAPDAHWYLSAMTPVLFEGEDWAI